jgi:hypothetical protein
VVSIAVTEDVDQRLVEKIGVVGLEAEEGLEVEGLLELVEFDSVRVKGTSSCSEFVVVVTLEGVLESDNS